MNREEYYRTRRIYRAVISSINRSHLRMPKEELDEVWDLFWKGIYMAMPPVIYKTLTARYLALEPWKPTNRSIIRFNYSYTANSYPHETRNP
jgi:hypothetical protein